MEYTAGASATKAGPKWLEHLSQLENKSRASELALPVEVPNFLPTIIAAAGEDASRRFLEFFTANIRNPITRAALDNNERLTPLVGPAEIFVRDGFVIGSRTAHEREELIFSITRRRWTFNAGVARAPT